MATHSKAEQVFPVYKVEHQCMISVQGDLTIGFKVNLPEIFTLSNECSGIKSGAAGAIKTNALILGSFCTSTCCPVFAQGFPPANASAV